MHFQKLNFKVDINTLHCICHLYDSVLKNDSKYPKEHHFTKEYKSAKNIIDLVITKFKKKVICKSNDNKKFKISIEYFEAYYLAEFLSNNLNSFKGIYEKTVLNSLKDSIYQQL